MLGLNGLGLLKGQLLDICLLDGLLDQDVQVLDLVPQLGVCLFKTRNVNATLLG